MMMNSSEFSSQEELPDSIISQILRRLDALEQNETKFKQYDDSHKEINKKLLEISSNFNNKLSAGEVRDIFLKIAKLIDGMAQTNKENLDKVSRKFEVFGIIGPKGCKFASFDEFVEKIYKMHLDLNKVNIEIKQNDAQMNQKVTNLLNNVMESKNSSERSLKDFVALSIEASEKEIYKRIGEFEHLAHDIRISNGKYHLEAMKKIKDFSVLYDTLEEKTKVIDVEQVNFREMYKSVENKFKNANKLTHSIEEEIKMLRHKYYELNSRVHNQLNKITEEITNYSLAPSKFKSFLNRAGEAIFNVDDPIPEPVNNKSPFKTWKKTSTLNIYSDGFKDKRGNEMNFYSEVSDNSKSKAKSKFCDNKKEKVDSGEKQVFDVDDAEFKEMKSNSHSIKVLSHEKENSYNNELEAENKNEKCIEEFTNPRNTTKAKLKVEEEICYEQKQDQSKITSRSNKLSSKKGSIKSKLLEVGKTEVDGYSLPNFTVEHAETEEEIIEKKLDMISNMKERIRYKIAQDELNKTTNLFTPKKLSNGEENQPTNRSIALEHNCNTSPNKQKKPQKKSTFALENAVKPKNGYNDSIEYQKKIFTADKGKNINLSFAKPQTPIVQVRNRSIDVTKTMDFKDFMNGVNYYEQRSKT